MAGAAEGIGTITLLVGAVCYFSGAFRGVAPASDRDVIESRQVPPVSVDRSAASNNERDSLISRLITDEVLTNVVRVGTTLEVFTGPSWVGMSFEGQQSVLVRIAAQYVDLDAGLVYLRDGRSGAPLGTFSLVGGVLKPS